MIQATTLISGYLVEVQVDDDFSQCWVAYNDRGTHYTASLAALEATGVLEDHKGRERRVPTSTLERISDWALARGY